MKTITASELQKLLSADPHIPLLDVRTPVEYDEVHVAGTLLEPLDSLNPRALVEGGKLPGDLPFYVLCRSGARAGKAAQKFEAEGFSNAVVVEGGTLAWIEAGFPVARGQSKVISLERQVRIAAGFLVVLGFLLSFLHPSFIWLSAFVGAGLPWNQR